MSFSKVGNQILIIINYFIFNFKGVIFPFKDQSFDELKSQHNGSNLFEDPLFPADSSSLFFTQMPPQGNSTKKKLNFK